MGYLCSQALSIYGITREGIFFFYFWIAKKDPKRYWSLWGPSGDIGLMNTQVQLHWLMYSICFNVNNVNSVIITLFELKSITI